MRQIVARLEGDLRIRCCALEAKMLALQSGSCNDVSLEYACRVVEAYDEMWRDLRERLELEDDEAYLFDRSLGAIFIDPDE